MVHIDFGHFLGHEVKVPGTTIERYKVTTRLAKPTAPRMLSPFFLGFRNGNAQTQTVGFDLVLFRPSARDK